MQKEKENKLKNIYRYLQVFNLQDNYVIWPRKINELYTNETLTRYLFCTVESSY